MTNPLLPDLQKVLAQIDEDFLEAELPGEKDEDVADNGEGEIENDFGDEDDGAVELEPLRQTLSRLVIDQDKLREVAENPALARVAGSLEQVDRRVVVEGSCCRFGASRNVAKQCSKDSISLGW